MDLQEKNWTNEKHVSFLHRMEANFVQTMLGNERWRMLTYASRFQAPLDRYLPDSSDSTRDLKRQRRYTISAAAVDVQLEEGSDTSTGTNAMISHNNRKRRRRSQGDASQDQVYTVAEPGFFLWVVPQIENNKSDKDDISKP